MISTDELQKLLDAATPGWELHTRPDGTMVILTRNAAGSPHRHIAEMSWGKNEPGAGAEDAALAVAAPDLAAELIAARAKIAAAEKLAEAAAEFASAKIEALRFDMTGRSPEDEPDPVVEADYVWALQSDVKAALTAWEAAA